MAARSHGHGPIGYTPRATLDADALRIVRTHLPAFLTEAQECGSALPSFVVDELEGLLRCGDFEHGFLRFNCDQCGHELRVPFACKARGTCPSCMGRRMCETAAVLVDHLLPSIPYRQWVLAFEGPMAVRLGYDADLLGRVCTALTDAVRRRLRMRAKAAHGLASVQALHAGAVVVVQRFRSDLGLYVHLHCLVGDGVYQDVGPTSTPVFRAVAAVTDDDLLWVLGRVHVRLGLDELDEPDIDPALAHVVRAGLASMTATSGSIDADAPRVRAFGMNLHAATTVDGRDRKRLERLCRYLLRPPFALDAIEWLADGRVRLHMPRRGGHVDMSPQTFLAKLAALVPPPGFHMIRYYGVFANRHHLRERIVPHPVPESPAERRQVPLFDIEGRPYTSSRPFEPEPDRPRRIGWAKLLARVFAIDVTRCSCGGRLKLTGAVLLPEELAYHLHGARGPPRPRPPGQQPLSFLA